MAAVTGPGMWVAPVGGGRRWRWWVAAVAGGWALVLLGGVFWSVRKDPATVPEQRDLGQAVPELRRATGALVAASRSERWVVRLGELRVEECALNPVWTGRRAGRDLTLYVPAGEAREALEGIAKGLPESYDPGVGVARGGTRLSLFADAGELIAVESEALSTDQVLTVRVDTGCRPPSGSVGGEPEAGPVPAVVAELGKVAVVSAVSCPGGGTAATFEVDGGAADPDSEPTGLPAGTVPVWVEPGHWAYRMGADSVVATTEGGRLAVSVTTPCRSQ
ncbi:hypothetical protein AB0M02_00850 [Actinoplanes sp. NPDC051861]|uniref:hypothetical protein n=1 Tax=Actinoplanes sp. NPDC051861 TaxID=3155170 RepID=UPI0034454474